MRLLPLLLFLALLCAGCQGEASSERRSRDPVVGVARPVTRAVGARREYTGTVESLNRVSVVPQVAGQLETVEVAVGDAVSRGQLIAVVDDSQLEAQVNQARATAAAAQASVQTALANLAASRDQTRAQQQAVAQNEAQVIEAEAAVEKAETRLRLTGNSLERIKKVAAQDLIAAQVVDESRAEFESAGSDLKAARAQLQAARGQLEQARLRVKTAAQQEKAAEAQVATAQAQADSLASALQAVSVRQGFTRVSSPIDGVVVERRLDPGAYVSPGGSTAVVVIASLERLRVAFQLSEADLSLVEPGQQVTVTFDALPGVAAEGTVQGLAGGLDPSTRTMRVEVRLSDADSRLRPGMLARLRLSGTSREMLSVPIQAVLSEHEEFFVYVVEEKVVARRPVVVDGMEGDVALIASGLSGDEVVIVRGTDLVEAGQAVEPVQVR